MGLYTKIYRYAQYHGVNRLVARGLVRTLRANNASTIRAAKLLLLPPRSPITDDDERQLLEAALAFTRSKAAPDVAQLDHPNYRLME
jgi:hypothetical protein